MRDIALWASLGVSLACFVWLQVNMWKMRKAQKKELQRFRDRCGKR